MDCSFVSRRVEDFDECTLLLCICYRRQQVRPIIDNTYRTDAGYV